MRQQASSALFFILPLLVSVTARAEKIPDEVLQQYYENCIGQNIADHTPERPLYCECVREGMESWSMDDFAAVAAEAKGGQQTPDKITALANICISKILH